MPRWGEYERTAATVINAYLGPVTGAYMERVGRRVAGAGLRTPVQVMRIDPYGNVLVDLTAPA